MYLISLLNDKATVFKELNCQDKLTFLFLHFCKKTKQKTNKKQTKTNKQKTTFNALFGMFVVYLRSTTIIIRPRLSIGLLVSCYAKMYLVYDE